MERVADYIIKRLAQNNIKHIFLITGRGILYLTDAIAKNPDIEGVCTFHEQGASYAAMAYASARDGMGACLVSTGCAATNAVTAALCAYQDNLPCIFISGQHMLHETTRHTGIPIRTFGSQEADIIGIVQPVTKYAKMIENPNSIAYELDKAIYLANEGRKGPVWIDVPLDIQNARIDPDALEHFRAEKNNTLTISHVEEVVHELEEAKRPILFIGGGVRSSEAIDDLRFLAEKYHIPVVFSTSSADAYGCGNQISIGAVGSLGGSRAGNFALQNADYILAIGTKLCSQSVGTETSQFARAARITVVDIDEEEHKKPGVTIDKLIIGDAKEFLQALNQYDIQISSESWLMQCLHWKEKFAIHNEEFIQDLTQKNVIDLYGFTDSLSKQLSACATVITDAGLEELIVPSTIRFHDAQRCLFPAAQGAMGYAIPAIIGAYYGGREDIVAVVGDGSIMMNIQELLVISKHNIPAKIFVINNNMYAVIRKRQQDLFRTRTIGNDPSDGVPAPDFQSIASCFGLRYDLIRTKQELEEGISRVLGMEGPCLCEVMCTHEQKYFHTSFAFNEKKKLVKRPLEDLSPFLNRKTIQEEMIIPMVEEL